MQWAADAQPKEEAGIKQYFQAAQQAAEIPETDLYDFLNQEMTRLCHTSKFIRMSSQ